MKLGKELLLAAMVLSAALTGYTRNAAQETANQSPAAQPGLPSIPAGKQGDIIRRGGHIFDQTPTYAAAYVGNQLSCANCHMQGGAAPTAAPMTGLSELFPEYNQRAGHVISLGQRLQECFVRSENGTPPPLDSPEMQALLAYIAWLSQGHPKQEVLAHRGLVKLAPLTGNPGHGQVIYEKQCAACHRSDGAGMPPVMPPLWGPGSYNDGAGMDQVPKMAAFVIKNMPQNSPGTLSAQEAYDVSAYIHSKPHSKFNQAYRKY